MQVFDQLAILFCYGGQTRKRLIDKKENMYCLEGENEEEFKDINCLIKYMAETRNLLPKRPIKVKPQQGKPRENILRSSYQKLSVKIKPLER